MHTLALLTLKADGSFLPPKDVTGLIAKLCRAIQLAMLTELHHMMDDGDATYQDVAMDELAKFVHEKHYTAFNSLMSLQHYASSVAYNTMSLPQIVWLDRENWQEMLYMGQHITQLQVKKVFQNLEEKMVELWEQKVMLGTKLRVRYGEMSDNLLKSEPGYSFLMMRRTPSIGR